MDKNASFSDYLKENIVLYGIIIAVIVNLIVAVSGWLVYRRRKNAPTDDLVDLSGETV